MIRCSALSPRLFLLAACSVSEDQEVAIGRQNAEEINAQLPIVTDPAISGYIQALGESIAKKDQSVRPGLALLRGQHEAGQCLRAAGRIHLREPRADRERR